MKNSLGKLVNSSQKNWDEMLDNVLFVYRISFSRVIEDSPFFLFFLSQDLVFNLRSQQKDFEDRASYKIELLKTLRKAYDKVKNIREIEQEKYKLTFDKNHNNIEFEEGDQVWVYFGAPEVGKTYKPLARFEGPFTIQKKLDQVTYRVKKDDKE